jgi:hypothetical protein
MSSTGKTRFICRVVRFQIALSGDTSNPTGHAAKCPACQAYYRTSDAIVNALRRDTTPTRQPTPDHLASRIALAVRQSTPQSSRRSHAAAWTISVGATAVVALSFFIIRQITPGHSIGPKTPATAEIGPNDVADLVANVDQLRIRILDSVEPAATKLAAQNPLTQELSSMQADARSALGFLALNFLPTDSARQLDPQLGQPTDQPTRG